eukprot:12883093-Prorocentrum_lima.AAC.1
MTRSNHHIRVPIVGRETWPETLDRMIVYDEGRETNFQTYYHAPPFYFLGSILISGILLSVGSKVDSAYSGAYR